MLKKIKYSCIGHGVLRAFILTMFCLVIYSLIASFISVNTVVTSVFFVVLTTLSILYGTIYATMKAGHNGWLMGILVALFYMLAIFIIGMICGREFAFGIKEFVRLTLALIVGALSGMIAVNL